MTMKLVQQTQPINTSEIDLKPVSCTAAEKEYEGTSNMLCRVKREDRSEMRSQCAAESWLHVSDSCMSSVS